MNPNFVPCLQEQYIGDINKNSDATDRGLRLFGNLINNRTFLLAFIRTLEAGKCNGTRNGWSVCVLVNRSLTGDEIVNKSVIPLCVQKFEEIQSTRSKSLLTSQLLRSSRLPMKRLQSSFFPNPLLDVTEHVEPSKRIET